LTFIIYIFKERKMKSKMSILVLLVFIFVTACAQATEPGGNPVPTSIPVTPTQEATKPSPTAAPTENSPAAAEAAAVQSLSTKYNIPVDQITIVSTEAVTWPDGCLGVVIPGVMCTQVVTDGYRIIMEANGQQYEFHTNLDGSSVIDATPQPASLSFVVRAADQAIIVVNPNMPLGITYNPAFNGFLPAGGSTSGTAYILDNMGVSRALAVSESEQHELSFIQNPSYALALWHGGDGTQPMLAWGTQPLGSDLVTTLQIANLDGSNPSLLFEMSQGSGAPVQIVAELWSADGKSVYFSKEAVGIGGYILFPGASNLYKIDIDSKQVTEVIPQTPMTSPQICLDAISGDYRYVADHCSQGVITIRDLQTSDSTTIQAPSDVTGYRLLGSARFNPTGDQVAFALAQGNPDDERGWVAVGPSTGGMAKLVLVGEAGSYYTIQGWLDDQTLLVQSTPVMCTTGSCSSELFSVGIDGSNLTNVAAGSFLAIIDNR
jgi:hypothetical protein